MQNICPQGTLDFSLTAQNSKEALILCVIIISTLSEFLYAYTCIVLSSQTKISSYTQQQYTHLHPNFNVM